MPVELLLGKQPSLHAEEAEEEETKTDEVR